jgi:adenine-specific DNA-methyltransferase
MTNLLDGLLGRVDDQGLRAALQAEVDRLRRTKDFGLVFEKHMPENVRLYSHPVRRGLRVEERSGETDSTWLVRRVRDGRATLVDAEGQESKRSVEELVVVRQFGEPIYPGLKSVGRIERGGDKPFHAVINGENYHALEMLLYAYEGKVDCIYIDPPYNTGAKDWKYNNDYVAADDAYRHSKWLSFMERRLELAKRLLNPEDSVLIVTIDEKEYLRTGLLLEQVFPSARIQMVSAVVNPAGTSREGLARVEEYLFFVFIGAAAPARVPDNLLFDVSASEKLPWLTLIRGGSQWRRQSRPNLCYPIWVERSTSQIVGVGEPFAGEDEGARETYADDIDYAWPVRSDGNLGIWRVNGEKLMSLVQDGFAYASKYDAVRKTWSIHYIQSGTVEGIASGDIEVARSGKGGIVELVKGSNSGHIAKTIWSRPSHNAGRHGSELLRAIIPGRKFPFPKSLYAVEDSLRIAVAEKPNALVLDFFAGSGTTAHAVVRLNRQDGGSRQSIVVTNNEVSVDEAKALAEAGHMPGDPAWEAQGIFQHITKPRIEAAVTGVTHAGEPVKGDYKFTDEVPMSEGFEENVEFVELTYLDRNDVSRGKAFEAIGPLLWMKAGARGEMIAKQKADFAAPVKARYAVLFDIDAWPKFVDVIRGRYDLEHVFIVTDSLAMYQQVVVELPAELETTMLYEDYLRNFEINMGGMK